MRPVAVASGVLKISGESEQSEKYPGDFEILMECSNIASSRGGGEIR
jgi:hypothetical protein